MLKFSESLLGIKAGDKFQVVEQGIGDKIIIYTVTKVTKKPNGSYTIDWDCIGRKYWYKKVSDGMIREWVNDKRLKKI